MNGEEGEDYLTAPEYSYDVLIENPPWNNNALLKFFKKGYESKKFFAFLVPTLCLTWTALLTMLDERGII